MDALNYSSLVLVLILSFQVVLTSQAKEIPIGAILGWEEKAAKTGFLFAVRQLSKRKPDQLFRLNAFVDVINIKDSFSLSTAICSQMARGVFMLFGAQRFQSSSTIRDLSETFHVPYVSPSKIMEFRPRPIQQTFQVHMKPSNSKAIVDLIMHFNWKIFHYLYDSEEGLFELQEILRYLGMNNYTVNVRMRRLHDMAHAHEVLRALDKFEEPDNSSSKYIVIDLSTEAGYEPIMRQIREVGMNKEGYNYILGTLDFLNLGMERYQHGGVNITGFQLVNYTSPFVVNFLKSWRELDADIWPGASNNSIHIDAALAYDSIVSIYKTLAHVVANSSSIFKYTFRRGQVYNHNRTKGVPCTTKPPIPWMHGTWLVETMKELNVDGVTGRIAFDKTGARKDYKFDIYNVGLNSGPSKIGDWSSTGHFSSEAEDKYEVTTNRTKEKLYIVTSIVDDPFLMVKKDQGSENGEPSVETEYEGFCVDLTRAVAEYVNIDYTIKLVTDGAYGIENKTTEQWNGMIGEIISREADIAVAPLSITSSRETVVDFSKPFMNTGISIMIKKPEKKKPGVFSFMQPFTLSLWLCIVIGYGCVGIGIFLVSRFSPSEWRSSRLDVTEKYNNFTLANSLWFAMGSLMLQGSNDDTCPRSASGRLIGGAWWFVVLICISSYTANLAAFLTIEKMLTPIESADDLVSQSEIDYGTLSSGSSQAFFANSRVSTYRTMYIYMAAAEPTVFVNSMNAGFKRVRESKGKYSFLVESVYNEYQNNRKPCDTMKVGPNLNSIHYGIATPKKSPIRDDITLAVLSLIEDGTLQKMKKTWWIDKGECGFDTGHRESKKRSLSLSNVAGVYFILISGLVLAIIIGVVEFVYSKSRPEKLTRGMYVMPVETTIRLADNNHVNNHGHHGNHGNHGNYTDSQHVDTMPRTLNGGKTLQ